MPAPMVPSIQSQAYRAQLAAQISNLPADVRAYIQSQYADSEVSVLPLPYWSTVRFQGTHAAGPPVTVTVDTTERKAFAYAIGQDMNIAGFTAAARTANLSDTNLLRATETRDNSDCWIWGLAAYITQDSEPALARRIWRECSVQISLNGTTQIPLGTLEMFPGAGGLYGAAPSFLKEPPLNTPGAVDNGQGASLAFAANGNPMAGNFFRLNQPFKWAGVGSQGADSSLVITCKPERSITESAAAARAAAAGVAAYTPPAAAGDLGTFVDVRFHLVCVAVAKRSRNV